MKSLKITWLFFLFLTVYLITACSGSGSSSGTDTDGTNGTNPGGDGTNPGDNGTDTEVCDEADVDLTLEAVKVMLVVDGSASMISGGKWEAATNAIEALVTDPANANTHFGLHVFPEAGWEPCAAGDSVAVPVGQGTGTEIVTWMKNNRPGLLQMTPLVSALEYYLGGHDTALHDDKTADYIVLISDGADSCYFRTDAQDKYNMLAGITDDLKDVSGIKTFAIGFGNSAAGAELDHVAANGGTSSDHFITATNGAQLQTALEEIAEAIRPCRYEIDSPDASADASKVNFYFDGTTVNRDRTHVDGWDWTKSQHLEVEFFGQACDQIKSGTVTIVEAKFGCPTKVGDGDTCASFDGFLQFPDTAVMILQDVSGSMREGNKWKTATASLTAMLVDDRNNHVKFGFDRFPGSGSCDISHSPMIPVSGSLSRLSIIEWLSSNNPELIGGTPLLDVLKRQLNRPGEIAEEEVSGAIVVVTDGEESCADDDDMPTALAEVTAEIVSRHDVRVFAVGFGAGIDEDQLNAIASSGNTGLTEFMHADNIAELEQVFAQISSMVTSCIFEVPYAGPNVDYTEVNLFFDGVVVPRDTTHSNGWDWVNTTTYKEIEFFGDFCEQLQKGEVSDVVIEFGCETVTPV